MFETKKTLIVVYKDEFVNEPVKKAGERAMMITKKLSGLGTILSILFHGRKKFGWITKRLGT